jgi:membrane protease YdiL (CAAX protease family)
MDWYTPPADLPAPPPISKKRCILLALLPPLFHFLITNFVPGVVTAPVINNVLESMDSQGKSIFEMLADPFIMNQVFSSPDFLKATVDGALYAGVISIALFAVMYRRRKPVFSPERRRAPSGVLWAVVLTAVAGNFVVTTGVSAIQEMLGTDLPTSSIDGLMEQLMEDEASLMILLVCMVFIAPIAEELCFRGLALNRFMASFSFWKANFMQAALFGLVHITPIQIVYAFLFGLLWGWVYHRTGRFGAAVLGHIVFNASPLLLGLIPNVETMMETPHILFLYVGIPSAVVFALALRSFNAATNDDGGLSQDKA